MSIKIIDQTPFHDEQGRIDLIGQVQARLQYGLNWLGDVKAQEHIIALLEKQLDHNYTLLRNVALPGTEVLLPLVLTGPAGVFLLNVTNMRGVYRARGEEWGTVDGVNFKHAPVNLVMRTVRLAAGLQKFIERQGLGNMVHVEGVLMTANPGMIVDSIRPAVRIIMSDAFDRFGISLLQSRNVLSPDAAEKIANRIIHPAEPKPESPAAPEPAAERATPTYIPQGLAPENQPADHELDAGAFGFSDEPAGGTPAATNAAAPDQAMPVPHTAAPGRSSGGLKLTTPQMAILGCLVLFWVCSMIAFIVYILTRS